MFSGPLMAGAMFCAGPAKPHGVGCIDGKAPGSEKLFDE